MNDYSQVFLTVAGVRTSVFYYEADRGVSVFVEMPGHGDSDIPSWTDLASLRGWFDKAVEAAVKKFDGRKILIFLHGLNGSAYGFKFLEPKMREMFSLMKKGEMRIVAHSFGCMAVGGGLAKKAVFLTPVPTVTKFYRKSLRLAGGLFRSRLVVFVHRQSVPAFLRGLIISIRRDAVGLSRVYRVGQYERKMKRDKRVWQVQLAQECLVDGIFADVSPRGVIFGTRDGMPREQNVAALGRVFPGAKVVGVKAGHLMPIEYPERTVEAICKVFGNQ
jgi:pimeloyl-ACP methyl ester carboxylesterase